MLLLAGLLCLLQRDNRVGLLVQSVRDCRERVTVVDE